MSENAEHGQLLELTARIVAAHVGHNEVAPAALPELIRIVHATLAGAGKPAEVAEKPQPAVPVKKSVFPDFIICLEDGKKLKMLKRHLKTAYDLTPEQYRGALESAARLPDGGAELCRKALGARQVDRPGTQAGCRSTRGGAQKPRTSAQVRRLNSAIGTAPGNVPGSGQCRGHLAASPGHKKRWRHPERRRQV